MTSILKTDEIQSQNGGAVVKMQTLKHPSASGNNLVLGSDGSTTINQISSSSVFPSGHIVQSVFNPTITNSSTTLVNSTTSTGRADVIGQITINSGNGVLIYLKLQLLIVHSTDAYGKVEIREGTVASLGDIVGSDRAGFASGQSGIFNFSFFAYDSTPADTTPDYVVAISTDTSVTNYVQINSLDSARFNMHLFEVKQ